MPGPMPATLGFNVPSQINREATTPNSTTLANTFDCRSIWRCDPRCDPNGDCTILSGVGIIAGMIPALRAARLDPVRAMRAE